MELMAEREHLSSFGDKDVSMPIQIPRLNEVSESISIRYLCALL